MDGVTVDDVSKEPKPVDGMPGSTAEKEEAQKGEVLAGKPAVCEEASKMEVDTAAISAQVIVNSLQTLCTAVAACCISEWVSNPATYSIP